MNKKKITHVLFPGLDAFVTPIQTTKALLQKFYFQLYFFVIDRRLPASYRAPFGFLTVIEVEL